MFFFRRGADTQKKPTDFYWRGPARVLLVDAPNTIWLSYRNIIIKASPERLRPASEEETLSLSQWLDGLTELKDQMNNLKNSGVVDLTQEEPPTEQELGVEEPTDTHEPLEDPDSELVPAIQHGPPEEPPLFPAPARRVRAKTGDYAPREEIVPSIPEPEQHRSIPMEVEPPQPEEPSLEYSPEYAEPESSHKREVIDVESDPEEPIEEPPDKRQRLEFIETLYTAISQSVAQRKRKEFRATDFEGKDRDRLLKSMTKEINQNLESGAYKLLDIQTSEKIKKTMPDKIMGSRYVLTKKPLEDADIPKAQLEDLLLDDRTHGPAKAKTRHVMQGFSDPSALDGPTTTPQVTRDTVVFIAQILSSLHWTPGYLDFTQAFHSGSGIDRELYARQPPEGIPGADPRQLLKLLKHCYGLTDGPFKWYEHLSQYLLSQGYVQSRLDPCLFFLFGGDHSTGQTLCGILGVATDDVFHGGNEQHWKIIEQISKDYKLGKNQRGSGRFTGKDIVHNEDGSIFIGQQYFVEDKVKQIPIDRKRRQQRFSRCNAQEIEQLRGLLGTVSWLCKETRSDLAGRVALLQQSFPAPKVRDIEQANKLAQEAHQFKHLGILVQPISLSKLRVGVVSDASWGNARESSEGLEDNVKDDYWEEQETCWVRHHKHPRKSFFHPSFCTTGPSPHDLQRERRTEMLDFEGERFCKTEIDSWNETKGIRNTEQQWVGRTVFKKALNKTDRIPPSQIRNLSEQQECLSSQGGQFIVYYDESLTSSQQPTQVALAAWKSYRLKRKVVSTLGAECQALVNGVGHVNWHRLLLLEVLSGQLTSSEWELRLKELPFISVTDSKSLYDSLRKEACPAAQFSDKRVAIDISVLRDEFRHQGGCIRWIDTRAMIADSLTKDCLPGYLRYIMEHGRWAIFEEGVALQRKALERKDIQKKVGAVSKGCPLT